MKSQEIFSQVIDMNQTELQECEPDLMIWTNAKLLVDVGNVSAGTIVYCISFRLDIGIVEISDEEGNEIQGAKGALKLTVEPITE
jgi:hypothetical protein